MLMEVEDGARECVCCWMCVVGCEMMSLVDCWVGWLDDV